MAYQVSVLFKHIKKALENMNIWVSNHLMKRQKDWEKAFTTNHMSIAQYTNGCPVKQANKQDRKVLGIQGGFVTDFTESRTSYGTLEQGAFSRECLSCTVLTFLANYEYLCPALGFALPVQMSFSSCLFHNHIVVH